MIKTVKAGSIFLACSFIFLGCAPEQRCAPEQKYVPEQKILKPLPKLPKETPVLQHNKTLRVNVIGQGVAPCTGSCSPAQALAMAKRAAIADAYRLIAEKVKGVYVEGNDFVKNMMIKKSTVRTHVAASLRNTNIVETNFKDGLCQVEMELNLRYADIVR